MDIFKQPISIFYVKKLSKQYNIKELKVYKVLILVVTFLTYMSYHLSRRSLSVVKPVLNYRNCSELGPPPHNGTDEFWCDWEPFKGPYARSLMGTLDLVFLLSYAGFMYVNGYIAERCNLRYYLTVGMIFSGICNCLFGLAYYLSIHSIIYFYIVQVITGVAQSSGWPAVLATVGNWFGPSKRGLIFGVWNANNYAGNIAGAAVAGYFVEDSWGLSFMVPGCCIAILGLLMFLVLIPSPNDVNTHIDIPKNDSESSMSSSNDSSNSSSNQLYVDDNSTKKAISILEAFKIPGVIEFSICLFFVKLVSYTFLDWLPYYISQTNKNISPQYSAYATITFDMGGIFGGIAGGYLADITGATACTCVFMLMLAIPSLYLYYVFGNCSVFLNELLQFICGIFVNSPYALITTAVSAELGTKVPSKSALATVSGIIDATGSLGSAFGPSLAGLVSEYGWKYVFVMVMVSDLLAMISIMRIVIRDIYHKIDK